MSISAADDRMLDTSVLVDVIRGEPATMAYVEARITAGDRLSVSAITVGEIYAGMRSGEEQRTDALFVSLTVVSIDATMAQKAGEYVRRYRHQGVRLLDALIAASAWAAGARLVTHNVRHFPMTDVAIEAPF